MKKKNRRILSLVIGMLCGVGCFHVKELVRAKNLKRIKHELEMESEAKQKALAVFGGNNIELENYILDNNLRSRASGFDWLEVLVALQEDGKPVELSEEQQRRYDKKHKNKKKPIKKTKYFTVDRERERQEP